MTIEKTTYPGTFDVSKFDYDNDEISNAISTAEEDFDNFLLEIHANWFWLRKYTKTIDSMGKISNIENDTVNVYGSIFNKSQSKKEITKAGREYPGSSICYLKPSYTDLQQEWSVENDDVIVDRDFNEWRVVETNERKIGWKTIFIKCRIVKIGSQK